MKSYIYLLFITISAALFSGCSKTTVDASQLSNRTAISTVTTGTSGRGGTTPTIIPAISFEVSNQLVKTTLSNKTLNMNYYEDVTILARKDSLSGSWAIIFTENFTGTQLAKFNYTTLGKTGVVTTNYAEPNLNNIVIRSTRDTAFGGLSFTKISFNRSFLFSNTYNSSTEAAVQYDYEMNTRETISFSAFITSATGKSSTGTGKTNLIYY